MTNQFLPFEHEAETLGYSLHSHGGDRESATYMKDGVALHVYYDLWGKGMVGTLSFMWRLLTISTGELSIPHSRLAVFEKQIVSAQTRLRELDMIEGRCE